MHFLLLLAPNSKGRDGRVRNFYIQPGPLDAASKASYPVKLFGIMRRKTEDLLLSDSNDQEGKDILRFILSLAKERHDVDQFKKGNNPWVQFRSRASAACRLGSRL